MRMSEFEYWNTVKRIFGIPYTFFELTFDQVIDHLKTVTLPLVSQTIPFTDYVYISPKTDILERGEQQSVLKINYDGEIHSVVNVYTSNLDIVAGFPINPIISDTNSAIDYSMDITKAKPNMQLSSAIYFTWEFIEPNLLKLFPPASTDNIIIEIRANHKSLETVPSRFRRDVIDLAIADLKDLLGNIRSRYTEYATPFGTINLNADALKNEAETTRSRIIEKFNQMPPNKLVSL